MDDPRKNSLPLEYSSPAQENLRETEAEQKRREALAMYNESTFGEGRPVTVLLFRYFAFLGAIVSIALLLPEWASYPVVIAAIAVYHYWDWRASR